MQLLSMLRTPYVARDMAVPRSFMFSGLVVEDGERQLALAGRGVVAPHEAQPPAVDRRRGAETVHV
jgi:hypothetical protein